MQRPTRPPGENRILSALPDRDRRHLLDQCERVDLARADVLYEPGGPIRRVFFPTGSSITLITPTFGHGRMEVGLVGDEGMLGIPLVLGVSVAPMLALVQGAGSAWQMHAGSFRHELEYSLALRAGLERYVHVLMCQLAQAAVCNRFHVVEGRLARWLLMTRERQHSNEFQVTHAFLAYVLGVRRAGVTRAASALQARKVIRYRRGEVTILDRRRLESAACGCYATDRDTYASVLN
jgi:CRP-like cAMP-binding protein